MRLSYFWSLLRKNLALARQLSGIAGTTPVARISVHTGTIRSYFGKGQHRDVGEPTAGHSDYYKCLYTRISIEIGGRYSGRNHTRKTPEGSGGKENVHTKSFHCSENLILSNPSTLLNDPQTILFFHHSLA